MPSGLDLLTQAVADLEAEVEDYKKREWTANRARQEKEGYITDLMTCHRQRIGNIVLLCEDGIHPNMLAKRVLAVIANPEPSLATARDQRLDVFTRPQEEDDLTASDLSEQDQFIKDRMDASTKHARDVRLKGPE